jgi:flagellar biogenesis protein FliO
MRQETKGKVAAGPGGLTGWLLSRFFHRLRGARRPGPRLALVERIALAPRQSLALVEAEGRRFLVATSAEGSPAFYALDERARSAGASARSAARVSW